MTHFAHVPLFNTWSHGIYFLNNNCNVAYGNYFSNKNNYYYHMLQPKCFSTVLTIFNLINFFSLTSDLTGSLDLGFNSYFKDGAY